VGRQAIRSQVCMSDQLITVRVGGVPEHFNSPWHIAIETGAFARAGLDVQWTTIDTGTGTMCKALAAGEIDIAVALTEGVVADIAKGGNHRILGVYIDAPLIWGVHVASSSRFNSVESLKNGNFGISRYGSGSHLMACVQAECRGWNPATDLSFTVVGNLDGARASMAKGEADAFMWEKFTTKPHVDSGEWRMAGAFETPWPCFVASASNDFMSSRSEACATMMKVLAEVADAFMAGGAKSVKYAAERYGLQTSDAQEWFDGCKWHARPSIKNEVLVKVMASLKSAGVLTQEEAAANPANLVSEISSLEPTMPSRL